MPISVEPARSSARNRDGFSANDYDYAAQGGNSENPPRKVGGRRMGLQQSRSIRVQVVNPAPVGFGSNIPSAGQMSTGSIPSTPLTPLSMGIEAKAFQPVTRSKASSARSKAPKAAGDDDGAALTRIPTIEHSGNFLQPEVQKGGVYILDPDFVVSGANVAQKTVKKMDEAEMKKWGLDSPRAQREGHLKPPPIPAPTIGQQRRALAEGDSPQRRPLSRDMLSGRPQSRGEEFRAPFEPLQGPQGAAMLDGFMMLQAASAELPEEVEVVDLSSKRIDRMEEADLVHFSEARKVNISDNLLENLMPLASLPSLQILNAAANGMSAITVAPGAFAALQDLDLSFNHLPASVPFAELSGLPSLRKLDLTGNAMPSLPEAIGGFTALEELTLACNGLSGTSLLSLQLLPQLKRLLMQDNVVSTVPDWTEAEPFPSLEELDLTNNHINAAGAMLPLEELPCLKRVALAGNPLSSRANLAAKRAALAKDAEYRAAGIPALKADVEQILQAAVAPPPQPAPLALPAPDSADAPGAYGGSQEGEEAAQQLSRIKVELKAPVFKPPSLSKLYGHGQLPVVVDDLAKALPDPDNPLAGMTGMLKEKDVNHDAVMAAFGRLESEIKGWGAYAEEVGYGLEPVDEGQEDDAEEYTDNTFLTGLGIPMEGLPDEPSADTTEESERQWEQEPSEEELPEELQDPTVQLAIGLGLDPVYLSIFSGHLGGDCTSAVKALRFALAHPLVDEDEGLRPKPNHFKNTTSTRAKQRERYLRPMDEQPKRPMPSLDVKMEKIQSIEDILSGMKDRLQTMEAKLVNEIGPESAEAALSLVATLPLNSTIPPTKGVPHSPGPSGSAGDSAPGTAAGHQGGGSAPSTAGTRGPSPPTSAKPAEPPAGSGPRPRPEVPPLKANTSNAAKASNALGYT